MKTEPARNKLLCAFFAALTLALTFLPSGFENRDPEGAVRCKGVVTRVDNDNLHQYGIIRAGIQDLDVKILSGPYEGKIVPAHNEVLGKLEIDKVFEVGDEAYMVLSTTEGRVVHATAQDHWRLDSQLWLAGLFTLALLLCAGWTGAKALLSFAFSATAIWKILAPAFLHGYDPVLISLGVVAALTASTLFLVGGMNRKALAAYLGTLLGVLATCGLAFAFLGPFKLAGAVVPYSETVLYTGFAHLDLRRIFLATVFLASSGAIMDLAMDVAAHQYELLCAKPEASRREVIFSGLRVGQAVVGTMTTTLLLAYSGGYVTLLMVFIAQGLPVQSVLNLNYVAAEVLDTLVGSFGLTLTAPFTALAGGLLLVSLPRKSCENARQ